MSGSPPHPPLPCRGERAALRASDGSSGSWRADSHPEPDQEGSGAFPPSQASLSVGTPAVQSVLWGSRQRALAKSPPQRSQDSNDITPQVPGALGPGEALLRVPPPDTHPHTQRPRLPQRTAPASSAPRREAVRCDVRPSVLPPPWPTRVPAGSPSGRPNAPHSHVFCCWRGDSEPCLWPFSTGWGPGPDPACASVLDSVALEQCSRRACLRATPCGRELEN